MTSAVTLAAPGGRLAPQAVAEYPFCVDEGFASLSAVVSYAGRAGEALVELIGPTGAVEGTATAVEAGDEAQQRLAVSAPAAGAWKLRVTSRRSAVLELSALVRADAAEQDAEHAAAGLAVDTGSAVVRYPRPIAVTAVLSDDEWPVRGAQVTGTVEDPVGGERELVLRDDGEEGDGRAGDGVYSGLLEPELNGVYTVRVSVMAKAGTAFETARGLALSLPEGAEALDPPEDVPLPADVQRFALAQVRVTGVAADDHGHDIATATPVEADDADVPGEIDAAGDHDFFRLAVPAAESALTFRVTELAFGMAPLLTLRDASGALLRGPLALGDDAEEYLFTTLSGLEPGAVVYAEVASAAAAGRGTYCFSAGPQVASDEYLPSTITASAGPGGSISPAGETVVAHGAAQTFILSADAHHHVDELFLDGAPLGPRASYTFAAVTADHELRASFAADDYTVTPSVAGGPLGHGTITPATPQTRPWGADLTFHFAAADGYSVRSVSVDGQLVQPSARDAYTFAGLDADHTLSVAFAPVLTPTPQPMPSYTISSSVLGGHGSVSPAGLMSVAYGATPTYLFSPEAGYRVDALTVDGLAVALTAASAYTFPGVAASHALTVSFAPSAPLPVVVFTITPLLAGGHGSLSPAGPQSVALGATPTFSFAPEAGYVVAAVKVDGVAIVPTPAASYSFAAVAADHTLEVSFARAAAPGALSTQAPQAARVRRGAVAVLAYRVSQAAASGSADVTISIADAGGRVVKTLRRVGVTLNQAHSARFTCTLPRGRYTFTVAAATAAGASSLNDASNRLTVR